MERKPELERTLAAFKRVTEVARAGEAESERRVMRRIKRDEAAIGD